MCQKTKAMSLEKYSVSAINSLFSSNNNTFSNHLSHGGIITRCMDLFHLYGAVKVQWSGCSALKQKVVGSSPTANFLVVGSLSHNCVPGWI